MKNKTILNEKEIRNKIHFVRGFQVMLDGDLAELYKVRTKVLNQAVKRNIERFSENFMFKLNKEEHKKWVSQIVMPDNNLRSQLVTSSLNDKDLGFQIGTSKSSRGGRRYLPYAFTEQGVAMLSGVRNE